MEKQKQIEEIKDWIDSMYGCDCAYYGVDGLMIAEGLYNAGYRKQEVVGANSATAADVVEVVRCKDCKYAKPMSFKGYFMCKRHHKYCRKADDFCSYGERK